MGGKGRTRATDGVAVKRAGPPWSGGASACLAALGVFLAESTEWGGGQGPVRDGVPVRIAVRTAGSTSPVAPVAARLP